MKINKCKYCNCNCHCSEQSHSNIYGICPCQWCQCDQSAAAKYRAIVKNKTDSTILIKAEGPTKEIAENKAMKICIGKSVQSSFKDACYVHYSGEVPKY
jgi:hypothetical protein